MKGKDLIEINLRNHILIIKKIKVITMKITNVIIMEIIEMIGIIINIEYQDKPILKQIS